MRDKSGVTLGAISAIAGLVMVYPAIASEFPQLIAQADEVLTSASIYRLENQVQLRPRNQSARAASIGDGLAPLDAVQTGASSLAELLFNEGSIARVDANTVFRFEQGLRRFQLPNRIAADAPEMEVAQILPVGELGTVVSGDGYSVGAIAAANPTTKTTIPIASIPNAFPSNWLAQTPSPPSSPPPTSSPSSPSSLSPPSPDSLPNTPSGSSESPSPMSDEDAESEDGDTNVEAEEQREEEVREGISETIFVLENGTALIISPPESIGTQIRTPQSRINIAASVLATTTDPAPTEATLPGFWGDVVSVTQWPVSFLTSLKTQLLPIFSVAQSNTTNPQTNTQATPLLPPPDRSSAAMAVHDPGTNTTQVFALTDGDITVSNLDGTETVALLGGQTVFVNAGEFSDVQEFNLNTFYQTVPLAVGLGPDQEDVVAQQPPEVQVSLLAVRPATLAAVSNQARRLDGFEVTFLQDALSGTDRYYDGNEVDYPVIILEPEIFDGTFVRTGDNTAEFLSDQLPAPVLIDVNIDDRTIQINGQTGISNDAGLSGNSAAGTVIFEDGRAVRVEVFDVNGDYDNIPIGGTRPGRLTTGIAPDR
jgi:hypothetical protein